MPGAFESLIAEMDEFSKAVRAGWTPGQAAHAARAWRASPLSKSMPSPGGRGADIRPKAAISKPAPRPETREEIRERLRARVRTVLPDVMAKAMAEFTAGRIGAVDVSKIEAECNRLRAIVA